MTYDTESRQNEDVNFRVLLSFFIAVRKVDYIINL